MMYLTKNLKTNKIMKTFAEIIYGGKEKAKELIDKFYQKFPLTMDVITTKGDLSWKYDNWKQAIECALIAVNEIMLAIPDASDDDSPYNHELKYWQEVKTEIENL